VERTQRPDVDAAPHDLFRAVKSQRFLIAADQENGTATGTVPATLALSLGTPATFGAFTPGVPKDYTAGTTANVIPTAGDGTLSVSDPSSANAGHLVNGSFFLPQKLQATEPRRHERGGRRGRRLGRTHDAADVWRPGLKRPGDAELQAADRRDGCPAHRRLQQDADVHPVHDHPVGIVRA
jgi:hypothetical protein